MKEASLGGERPRQKQRGARGEQEVGEAKLGPPPLLRTRMPRVGLSRVCPPALGYCVDEGGVGGQLGILESPPLPEVRTCVLTVERGKPMDSRSMVQCLKGRGQKI